jgi:hypothetical protein
MESPSIQSLIDLAVKTKADYDPWEDAFGGEARWRASQIGYCPRAQMLKARGAADITQIEVPILRRFAVGNVFAEWVKQTFQDLGILLSVEQPLYDKELSLGAHCDFLIGGPVDYHTQDNGYIDQLRFYASELGTIPYTGVELKSVHSRSWWYKAKKGGFVAGHHQMLQAAAQGLLWQRLDMTPKVDRWVVLTVSKDDLTMQEDVVLPEHFEEALHRVQDLNYHWERGTFPPCTCFIDMDGGYWKYCRYYEGSEASRKKSKDSKPDGPCCIPHMSGEFVINKGGN